MPGLPHRLGQGRDGVVPLTALRERFRGVLEGDRLVGRGTVEDALAAVGATVEGLQIAAAVGPVTAWLDGMPMGEGGRLLREAVRYARVGEVFALPGVRDVPDGVGTFLAPAPIVEAVGVPVQILKDYRQG